MSILKTKKKCSSCNGSGRKIVIIGGRRHYVTCTSCDGEGYK